MCMPIIIQYRELENLLYEIEPGKPVHLHVLEQIKTTTSNALSLTEMDVSVNVRVVQGNQILSWHHVIDEFRTYTPNGAHGTEKEQRDTAWDKADKLLSALSTELTKLKLNLKLDGIVELSVRTLIPGIQNLVPVELLKDQEPMPAQAFAFATA